SQSSRADRRCAERPRRAGPGLRRPAAGGRSLRRRPPRDRLRREQRGRRRPEQGPFPHRRPVLERHRSDAGEELSRHHRPRVPGVGPHDRHLCTTPLSPEGGPDLDAVTSASTVIAAHLTPGTLVILESTTYPGTTEEVIRPLLEESGLVAGADFHLAFSPERIDPGNP